MSRSGSILSGIAVVCLSVSAARAATFVETFDSGNEGGWTWGVTSVVETTGGNPGAYLHTAIPLDTFAPQPRTTTASTVFTGDYRAMGVTAIGIDLITFAVDFSAAGRPCTLMLIHDNDTPGNSSDDTAAYVFGANVPLVGQGWLSYDFPVPSNQTSLPAGWHLLNLGDSGAPPLHSWDQVIQHVSTVKYFYGDPELFFIFQQWNLGLDNPRITSEAVCGDAAGAVPDGWLVPGEPLRLDRDPLGELTLTWGVSCSTCDTDYAIYEGASGAWTSYHSKFCSTGGATTLAFTEPAGSVFYLVVPTTGARDGSYGTNSDGVERPPPGFPFLCRPQQYEPSLCR